MPASRPTVTYKCQLHRTGTFLLETIRLLEALAASGDFNEVKRKAYRNNLLGKTSTHTVGAMLGAFRRRFLVPRRELPPVSLVAKAMMVRFPDAAKMQILFPYYLLSDMLVADVYRYLVLSEIEKGNGVLNRDQVLAFLKDRSAAHPELEKWAPNTRMRWVRGMLAFLRDFGLMERAPGLRLKPLRLRREAFAFFWLWFWQQGLSLQEARTQELWELLQVPPSRCYELLVEGERQGWWHYRESGGVAEFHTPFTSLEAWLDNVLGHRQY